jgi:hypothetical protein
MHLLPNTYKPLGLAALLALAAHGGLGCGGDPLPPPAALSSSHSALSSTQSTCLSFQRGSGGLVADAELSTRQPDKHLGDKPVAAVSHTNGQREHLLLRFDTSAIPSHATVTSATLTLWQTNSGRPSSLRAHAVTRPWQEGSVSWRSFGSSFVSEPAASLDTPGPSHPGTRSLDVSALASAWVSQPDSNHGLLLAQPEGKVLLDTSESPHPERRPRLEVCYSEAPSETPTEQLPQGTSLLLQVVDSAGNPIPTALISSQLASFPPDSSGHHLFENLRPGLFRARVDAHGYTSASVVVDLRRGAHVGYEVRLLPRGNPIHFQAEAGGLIETEQVRVTLPPNALRDGWGRPVTGTAEATIVPLNPTHQLSLMPGPLEGPSDFSGENVQLESLFMAEVSLWKDGAPVWLAPGASATLEFILPDAVASRFQAGDTVPAWWFDLDWGVWREEGVGTLQPSQSQPGKLSWVATVSHFTWWNSDAPVTDKSCVDVSVVNTKGQPVPNVPLEAEGTSYTGYSKSTYTNSQGHACLEIKRGGTANVFARSSSTSGMVTVTGSSEASSCGTSTCTPVRLELSDIICTPGARRDCASSGNLDSLKKGLCRAGSQQCNVSGTAWGACTGEVLPAPETCESAFDEDCDGLVNEDCTCVGNEGQPCYGGPIATQGVGICRSGVIACDPSGQVACMGQQIPQPETCSTLEDDDCDGSNECEPVAGWLWVPEATGCYQASFHALSVDGEDNTVTLGRISGTVDLGGPVTGDPQDHLVAKFNASGQPLWSRLIESTAGDDNPVLTVDGTGNILIAGDFSGSLRVGTLTLTSESASSLFVVKLSPTGDLLWAQRFGGGASSRAWVESISTDSAGHVALSGNFHGSLRIGDMEHPAGPGYLMKLGGSSGQPLWSKSYSTGGWTPRNFIAMDAAGNVWLTGSAHGPLDLGGLVITHPEGMGIFLAKFDGITGAPLWGRHITSELMYTLEPRLQIDNAGNVLLLLRAGISSLLMKVDAAGMQLWARFVPTPLISEQSRPLSFAIDASGNSLIAGGFWGAMDLGGGMRGDSIYWRRSAFLVWYDTNGNYLMDKVFTGWVDAINGTSGEAFGVAVGTDGSGNVVFTGDFDGTMDFGTGPVDTQNSCDEPFLLKLDPTP